MRYSGVSQHKQDRLKVSGEMQFSLVSLFCRSLLTCPGGSQHKQDRLNVSFVGLFCRSLFRVSFDIFRRISVQAGPATEAMAAALFVSWQVCETGRGEGRRQRDRQRERQRDRETERQRDRERERERDRVGMTERTSENRRDNKACEKRPTKETYTRDPQKRPTKELARGSE